MVEEIYFVKQLHYLGLHDMIKHRVFNIVNWKKYLLPGTSKRVDRFLEKNGTDVHTQISNRVFKAIRNKEKKIVIVVHRHVNNAICIEEHEYNEYLSVANTWFLKIEDYLMCGQIKDYVDRTKNKKNTIKKIMKGTLFSSDFVLASNGDAKLIEVNTDTGFISSSLTSTYFDASNFISILSGSNITQVDVIYKGYQEYFVNWLESEITANASFITTFNKHQQNSNTIYPETIADSSEKFIFDERIYCIRLYSSILFFY